LIAENKNPPLAEARGGGVSNCILFYSSNDVKSKLWKTYSPDLTLFEYLRVFNPLPEIAYNVINLMKLVRK